MYDIALVHCIWSSRKGKKFFVEQKYHLQLLSNHLNPSKHINIQELAALIVMYKTGREIERKCNLPPQLCKSRNHKFSGINCQHIWIKKTF